MSLQLGRSLTERWLASLAWSAEMPGSAFTMCLFRRGFELADVPPELVAFVSANSRYRLWVNGQPVGRGPLKGTCEHYHYEAYDLAPYLAEGKNVLAAEVRWFGEVTPTSEVHGPRPWFLVQGPLLAGLDTPEGWRVFTDRSVSPDTKAYIANAHHFLGHWERVDGRESLHGWTEVDFNDGEWAVAERVGAADVAGTWGESHPEQTLYPRDVPALVEEPRRFVRTWRDGYEYVHLFGEEPTGWELEAGEGGEIVLDAGALTTGYPQLVFDGGADRTVELIYGECLLRI
ncbi:MAG: alpha-L-rhamnosidase N-terminal domain-containing protein, partial [Anaerolineae bacterium]